MSDSTLQDDTVLKSSPGGVSELAASSSNETVIRISSDSERQDSERQEFERQESERQESERQESERQDSNGHNEKPDIEAGYRQRKTHLSTVQNVLEALGLSIVYNLLGKIFKWDIQERPETVMDQKRTIAAIRCLVHIIPAAGCLVLFTLNLTNWYLGSELQGPEGQDSEKLAALQFVAKLHELLMLSSIGVILITHIRKELAFGDGIPFGALFSGNQFQSINILWSLEFWGTIYHHWPKKRKKGYIVSLILICSVLGLSVGPSTANLMRPRLDNWPAGGTPFWINSSNATLFPTMIEDTPELSHCTIDSGDLSCPSGEWNILNSSLFSYQSYTTGSYGAPHTVDLQNSIATRTMQLRSRSPFLQGQFRNKFTIATVPYSFIADSIFQLAQLWNQAAETVPGTLLYRLDNAFAVNVYQPVVISRCYSFPIVENSTLQYGFPFMNSTTFGLDGRSGIAPNSFDDPQILANFQLSDNAIYAAINSALRSDTLPSLYWLNTPELLKKTNSSLSAIAIIPRTGNFEPSYHCCSTEIRVLNASASSGQYTTQDIIGAPDRWREYRTYSPEIPRIFPQTGWASYLNPVIAGTNSTVFSVMTSKASQWDYKHYSMGQYPEISTETILSTLLANGIGRSSYNASVLLEGFLLKTPSDKAVWVNKILPKNLNFGGGQNAFDIPGSVLENSTEFQFQITNYGYSYSSSGKVQKSALVVLLLYVLFVFAHSMGSVWTGLSSRSWGSPSEIAALAINSSPSSELCNTGSGIKTVTIFEKNIQLEAEGGVLQLAFTTNKRANPIEANKFYG